VINSIPLAYLSFGAFHRNSIANTEGASGSGVPFHTHGAVFAEVLYGRKRWFLVEPKAKPTYNPDETSLRWLTSVQPSLSKDHAKIFDCTLGHVTDSSFSQTSAVLWGEPLYW
jgi:hypothetical protein